ncbi:VOC family protein [Paucilactobacillus nenjiangensis]|uniref:VOC family protein n=1 Tax=Paucilactobacillus nenjiangensis TaxID=1296540 RepID=UPI0010F524CB|nr:VOC family protein [Paucilactobacillus nenjiangensis]
MDIHHISSLAAKTKPNQHFYTQVLGLRQVKYTVNQENPHMVHLFYGDYLGSPGTVITFFIVPFLGRRVNGNHDIYGVYLGIPTGTLSWWTTWIKSQDIEVETTKHGINFNDPDDFRITLQEIEESLQPNQIIPTSPVPAENQIIKIIGTDWIGPDIAASEDFFKQYLNLNIDQNHRIEVGQNQFIQLIQSDQPDERTRFGRGSTDHLALASPTDDDLFSAWSRAADQGWEQEVYKDRTWFKSIYLRDPSDNRLELATVTPGFTVDEPLETLGESLVLPKWLEPRRAEIEDNFAHQSV